MSVDVDLEIIRESMGDIKISDDSGSSIETLKTSERRLNEKIDVGETEHADGGGGLRCSFVSAQRHSEPDGMVMNALLADPCNPSVIIVPIVVSCKNEEKRSSAVEWKGTLVN